MLSFINARWWFSLACVLTLCAQTCMGQTPNQEAVIRIDVDLVQVDAVVTDSQGTPITNLRAEDFVVLQDGVPQEITHFSFIRTRDPRPAASAREKTDSRNPTPAVVTPPVTLKREAVRRVIALVVDDLGLAMDSTLRVRESIRQWIENQMQPDDLVAVMRTGGSVGALQQFTNDKRLLRAAADRISYNAASRVGVSAFQPISGSSGGGRQDAYGFELPMAGEERDLQFTLFSLASVQYIINALAELPGRKALVLFSEHLETRFDDSRGQNQGRTVPAQERMRRLIDAANRAGVVIHSIDPRGVVYTGTTAEDNLSELSPEQITEIPGRRHSMLVDSQDALAVLSKQTGGLFLHNRNDVARALEVAANDGDGYYLLGYQPDAKVVNELRKGKPKFHSIQVRVKRPGLTVRSRSEFFSSPGLGRADSMNSRPQQVEKALNSPFRSESIRIRLTPLFSQNGDGKPVIHALVHFDVDTLVFADEQDGWRKASVELVASMYDADGQLLYLEEKTWHVRARGQTYENMQRSGISFLMNVPAKSPGAYQMRMVVRDTRNGSMGSATQFVEIPNLRNGKLALSGILLAAESDSLRTMIDQAEGPIEDADHGKSAAVRVFAPGEKLAWAYQVLNAKTGIDRKPQLQTRVRLFHEGKELYAGKPSAMTAGEQGSSKRMVAADRIQLNNLPPGYYVLQLEVTDMLAKGPERTAVQAIDFDIVASKRQPDTR